MFVAIVSKFNLSALNKFLNLTYLVKYLPYIKVIYARIR